MTQQPDFQQMNRHELRTYVLAHREDNEALRIYMKRLQTEPGVIRHTGGLNEEDFDRLERAIANKIKDANS